MKSALILCAAIASLASAPAFASADLAQKKNCMACHATDKKLIGPSYKDVAAKYAGQKDAADKLAQKIVKGGAGVWGQVPMPANPQVNEAEAKQLAAWVLTVKYATLGASRKKKAPHCGAFCLVSAPAARGAERGRDPGRHAPGEPADAREQRLGQAHEPVAGGTTSDGDDLGHDALPVRVRP
jgi:cytochrome c